VFKDEKGNKIAEKKYTDLTVEEKRRIPPPPPIPLKKSPTEKEYESFKNETKFAVWIDGNNVSNSDLNKYKVSDFVFYTNSFVAKNARSKKFSQEYQVSLYTDKGYINSYEKKHTYGPENIEIISNNIIKNDTLKKSKKDYGIKQIKINNENCFYTVRNNGEIDYYNSKGFQINENGEILKSYIDSAKVGKVKYINGKKYYIREGNDWVDGKIIEKGYLDKSNETLFYFKIGDEVSYYNKSGIECDKEGNIIK
jgi:hypothetical protein